MGKIVKAIKVGNEIVFITDSDNVDLLDDDVWINFQEAREEEADAQFHRYLRAIGRD